MNKKFFVKGLTMATIAKFDDEITKCLTNGTEQDLNDLTFNIMCWVEGEIMRKCDEYLNDIGSYSYMVAEQTVAHVKLDNELTAYLNK